MTATAPVLDQTATADVGVVGLAIMGANLARNLAHHGHGVAVHNRTASRTPTFVAEIFRSRDEGDLDSYLIDVTAEVLAQRDARTGSPLVDSVVDAAGQKAPAAGPSRPLPAALVQGQRDYFGAHTYRRVDDDGFFHTAWSADRAELRI